MTPAEWNTKLEAILTRLENAVQYDIVLRQSQARSGPSPKKLHHEAPFAINALVVELIGEDEIDRSFGLGTYNGDDTSMDTPQLTEAQEARNALRSQLRQVVEGEK